MQIAIVTLFTVVFSKIMQIIKHAAIFIFVVIRATDVAEVATLNHFTVRLRQSALNIST